MCNLSEEIYEKGIEKGMEKGKIEDALEMLKDGVSLERVAKYTKFSLSFVKELAQKQAQKHKLI